MPSRDDEPPAPPPVDYEPWPRRPMPRWLKVLIWAAIGVHALGIIPAFILLWHAFANEDRLGDLITGGACCIPVGLLMLLGLFVLMTKAGERDDERG